MAKLDFPDASYSPWVAPNNVIYTYIGTSPNGYWEANTANAATNLTAVFVERTGSTMTGALKLDNAGSVSLPDISFDGDINTGLFQPGADSLAITTGGTQRVTVDSSGRVGIGTSNPNQRLTVGAGSGPEAIVIQSGTGNTGELWFAHTGSSGYQGAIVYNHPSSFLTFHVNSAERLRIDSAGNVGIGTSDPDAKLELNVSSGDGLLINSADIATVKMKTISGSVKNWGFATTNLAASDFGIYQSNSNGGDPITAGTARLYINSSGNVGIGTTSPDVALMVHADSGVKIHAKSANTTAVLELAGTRSLNAVPVAISRIKSIPENPTGNSDDTSLAFETRSQASGMAEHMRIDSSGRVGIGTTSPGFSNGSGVEIQRNGTACLRIHDNTNSKAGEIYADSSGLVLDALGTGAVTTFDTGGTERMRIDGSGRLLVGTSSARSSGGHTGSFQLEGTSFATSTALITANSNDVNGAYLNFGKARGGSVGSTTIVQSGDVLGQIQFNGSDGTTLQNAALITAQVDGTPGANDMPGRLSFSTTADGASSPTERMRITQAGNVSFNGIDSTTTNGNVGKVYKFFGGSANPILAFETTGTNANACLEYRRTGRSGNARASQINIGENASNQGQVDVYSSGANAAASGGVRLVNGATSWSTISDIRLKNVASSFDNALSDVSSLEAFRFTWINDENATPQVGLSAQSVQAVLPEAVSSGTPISASEYDDTEYLSVRYTEVIPLLVAALQESKQRIEQLEARLSAIEAA